jgi:hypothetical protein
MSRIGTFADMGGKRTEANFRRNDAIRVIQSAKAAGIEVGGLEVVLHSDGSVTFRVLTGNAGATATTPDSTGTKVWDAEIAKLRAATPKGGGK